MFQVTCTAINVKVTTFYYWVAWRKTTEVQSEPTPCSKCRCLLNNWNVCDVNSLRFAVSRKSPVASNAAVSQQSAIYRRHAYCRGWKRSAGIQTQYSNITRRDLRVYIRTLFRPTGIFRWHESSALRPTRIYLIFLSRHLNLKMRHLLCWFVRILLYSLTSRLHLVCSLK
jgi:hypothetical protein